MEGRWKARVEGRGRFERAVYHQTDAAAFGEAVLREAAQRERRARHVVEHAAEVDVVESAETEALEIKEGADDEARAAREAPGLEARARDSGRRRGDVDLRWKAVEGRWKAVEGRWKAVASRWKVRRRGDVDLDDARAIVAAARPREMHLRELRRELHRRVARAATGDQRTEGRGRRVGRSAEATVEVAVVEKVSDFLRGARANGSRGT